jgi:hypothetical protein
MTYEILDHNRIYCTYVLSKRVADTRADLLHDGKEALLSGGIAEYATEFHGGLVLPQLLLNHTQEGGLKPYKDHVR